MFNKKKNEEVQSHMILHMILRNIINSHYSEYQMISNGTRKNILGIKQYSYFTVCPLLRKMPNAYAHCRNREIIFTRGTGSNSCLSDATHTTITCCLPVGYLWSATNVEDDRTAFKRFKQRYSFRMGQVVADVSIDSQYFVACK